MAEGGMKERREHFKTPYGGKAQLITSIQLTLGQQLCWQEKKVGLLSVDLKPLTFPQRGLQGS